MNCRKITLFLGMLLFVFACSEDVQTSEPVPTPNTGGAPKPSVAQFNKLVYDQVNGKEIVLVGRAVPIDEENVGQDIDDNLTWDFATAFERLLPDGTLLDFININDRMPIIMQDQEGNLWDIFGNAVDGPRRGTQLTAVNGGIGFWFVFGAMYPGVEIFRGINDVEKIELVNAQDWGIPTDVVVRGAGVNGIPAINDPKFVLYESEPGEDFLPGDDELVVGVVINDEVKAYPHYVLDWHEIVNDEIGGMQISLSYCPLTGTAKIWNRDNNATEMFGVSGLLYNSNLMPFDFSTQSIWHQLEGRCVNGDRLDEEIGFVTHIETTWGRWKQMYSETLVLTAETGFNRDYGQYPYGDYRSNHDFLIGSLAFDDDRLPRKELVYSIIVDGKAKVYPKGVFF